MSIKKLSFVDNKSINAVAIGELFLVQAEVEILMLGN